MKKITILITLLVCMISCNGNGNSKNEAEKFRKGWTLVWEDEFDKVLDESSWSKIPRGEDKDRMRRYMSHNEALYVLQDGNIVLRGMENTANNGSLPFLTAGISGNNIMERNNVNRIEVRARMNPTPGATAFISLLPPDTGTPETENISVNLMERFGVDEFVYQSVSSEYTTTLKMTDNPPSICLVGVNPNQYHIYGVEKYPDSLVFFVDGIRTRKYPRVLTDTPGQFPFDDTDLRLFMGIRLDMDTDPADLPADMFVDWVRVYEPERP